MKIPRGLKVFLVIIVLIGICFGGLSLLIIYQRSRLDGLKEAIAGLEEEAIPLRFMITERGEGFISARIRFYDRDGGEVGLFERRLEGQSLFLDFQAVKTADGYLAFPSAVFTDAIPASQGASLWISYDDAGFPGILAKKGLAPAARRAFAALFLTLRQGRAPKESFGSAVHDVKDLASFEPGLIYKIVTRKKGGIEVMED